LETEKILVVEDNSGMSELLTGNFLPDLGYDSIAAGTGEEALTLIEQEIPSLVLLDIGLPDMTGMDLLRRFSERGIRVPVIITTAQGSERIATEVFRLGVCDYLTKPVEMDDLAAAIERAFHSTRLQRERDELVSKLERRVRQASVLGRVGKMITSALEPDEVLRRIVEAAVYLTSAEEGFLLLYDEETEELLLRAEKNLGDREVAIRRILVNDSLLGQVLQSGSPLRTEQPIAARDLKLKTGFLVKSSMHVPLKVHDKVLGILSVDNAMKPRTFTDSDESLLISLADFAAIAIDNARLYEESQQRAEQSLVYARELDAAHKSEQQQREALDGLRSSFLNSVGHELRTPMTVILQTVEILQDTRVGPLNQDQTELIEAVFQHSRHLRRMIDGLVTFATFSAKQGQLKLVKAPLRAALDEAEELAIYAAKAKDITIHAKHPAKLPELNMDTDRLTEAIGHLLDNALKFSPSRSTINLESRVDEDLVHISVIDRGPGIPEAQLQTIWEGFQQMSSSQVRGLEGLGLGLAMTRCIVEAHGGYVTVQSTVSQGSVFTISLPLHSSE
jgi:K+-sensing histidine kinase KdpD